jgi:hypothetical protein
MSTVRRNNAMRYLKIICCLGLLAVLASNMWSMSRWSEARGVYDDLCYLRQAHLFQRFGLSGLDTNLSRDDDSYMASKLREIGFPTWSDPANFPCHTSMAAANKQVLQYPPGTGFVLALFPQGFQVIPLYVSATVIVFGFALLGIFYARSKAAILLAAGFGCLAIYLMINPAKASYSVAPTVVACALAGLVTARLFLAEQRRDRLLLAGLVGLVLGVAVNFRLANLFLSAGYFLFFGFVFLRLRKLEAFLQGGLFGLAYLVGIAPTLIANAINAGSPFATTYGADPTDLRPPVIDASILWAYVTDLQCVLLILAGAWVVLISRLYRGSGIRSVAFVTALNLGVNVAFFMTHPTFNPYYTIPIAMLSLWSLLFASLLRRAESGDDRLMGQAAKA